MLRFAKALLCLVPASGVLLAQNPPAPQPPAANAPDKSQAYYNFAMGRLYAEMASEAGNKNDYVAKAIQYYQAALKLDPSAGMVLEELTDLYVATGRLKDAVTLAEDLLTQNPENLDARRMLGRIYLRALGEGQPGRGSEENLKLALEQFEKITQKDPNAADSWIKLGHLYRMSNRAADAEKAYNAALKAQPDSEDALTGIAMLLSDKGDAKGAIEKLQAATRKNPSETTLAMLAEQYEQMHDYKAAAEVLRKALEMAPDNERLAHGLAEDLLASDQYDEALKLYQQMAADEPRDPQLQLNIADIYRAKHDLAKAREAINKAKALEPQSREVRFAEARLLEAEGKNDQALAILKALLDETQRRQYAEADARRRALLLEEYGILARSMEHYQVAVDAFHELGDLHIESPSRVAVQIIDTYRQAKDYANAQKEVDLALKSFPDDRMIQVEHATVLSDVGKVDEAVAELGKLPADGRGVQMQMTIAQFYEKAKRYADMGKALDAAEKLAASNEEKAGVYFTRGAMYERLKQYDASETAFRKVLDLEPNHAEALNYLGYMFADRNIHLDEASQMVKKALEIDPNNGPFLDSLGWVYYRQGKLKEAEGLLQQALDRIGGAGDPTVHEHLGDVLFKEGKTKEAIAQWQTSLKGFQAPGASDADPEEAAKVSKKLDDARVKLAQESRKK